MPSQTVDLSLSPLRTRSTTLQPLAELMLAPSRTIQWTNPPPFLPPPFAVVCLTCENRGCSGEGRSKAGVGVDVRVSVDVRLRGWGLAGLWLRITALRMRMGMGRLIVWFVLVCDRLVGIWWLAAFVILLLLLARVI